MIYDMLRNQKNCNTEKNFFLSMFSEHSLLPQRKKWILHFHLSNGFRNYVLNNHTHLSEKERKIDELSRQW